VNKYSIERLFPNLSNSDYSIKSPATSEYNCTAWAAGDIESWWEPDPLNLYYWPPTVPREYTLEAYIKAFELSGYSTCENAEHEEGFEKIAIYVGSNGKPTHVSRQQSYGYWTSKLGKLEDIEHNTIDGLAGSVYGSVSVFMKRPR
jgi:hypothetical protein